MAVQLFKLTGKKEYVWTDEQEEAFQRLKKALATTPVLGLPNSVGRFVLDTDASQLAVSGVLSQIQDGQERLISFGSFALLPEQRNYCTTRQELLAVIRFTRQYRHYLLGKAFTVRTDHNSLTWLLNFKEPRGQLARWLEELSQYDMKVVHRPGKYHANADGLSRLPQKETAFGEFSISIDLADLPYGGCKYCTRAHQNWQGFSRDVDYVVPLSQRKKDMCDAEDDAFVSLREVFESQISLDDALQLTINTPRGEPQPIIVSAVSDQRCVYDFDRERVMRLQAEEQEFQFIIAWLCSHKEPSEGEILAAGPEEKYYWINRVLSSFKDGIIWWRREEMYCLLVPGALRQEVLYLCHNIPMADHQGLDRTKATVRAKYAWRGLGKDVTKYIQQCDVCNRCKKSNRKAKCEMTINHAGAPMERVH
jgi:hypothetical protein